MTPFFFKFGKMTHIDVFVYLSFLYFSRVMVICQPNILSSVLQHFDLYPQISPLFFFFFPDYKHTALDGNFPLSHELTNTLNLPFPARQRRWLGRRSELRLVTSLRMEEVSATNKNAPRLLENSRASTLISIASGETLFRSLFVWYADKIDK